MGFTPEYSTPRPNHFEGTTCIAISTRMVSRVDIGILQRALHALPYSYALRLVSLENRGMELARKSDCGVGRRAQSRTKTVVDLAFLVKVALHYYSNTSGTVNPHSTLLVLFPSRHVLQTREKQRE